MIGFDFPDDDLFLHDHRLVVRGANGCANRATNRTTDNGAFLTTNFGPDCGTGTTADRATNHCSRIDRQSVARCCKQRDRENKA